MIAIVGAVLSTVKVELGPLAVKVFPARSDQAALPTVILAVPVPEQPVMVTVATEPVTLVDLVQPVFVPLIVIPELIVVLTMVPRLVSEKVRV